MYVYTLGSDAVEANIYIVVLTNPLFIAQLLMIEEVKAGRFDPKVLAI